MTLAELLAGLERERALLAERGLRPEDIDVVVWTPDGETAPVTDLDHDLFEDISEGGRWVVEIRKDGDP